jgi:hypothetical protein
MGWRCKNKHSKHMSDASLVFHIPFISHLSRVLVFCPFLAGDSWVKIPRRVSQGTQPRDSKWKETRLTSGRERWNSFVNLGSVSLTFISHLYFSSLEVERMKYKWVLVTAGVGNEKRFPTFTSCLSCLISCVSMLVSPLPVLSFPLAWRSRRPLNRKPKKTTGTSQHWITPSLSG